MRGRGAAGRRRRARRWRGSGAASRSAKTKSEFTGLQVNVSSLPALLSYGEDGVADRLRLSEHARAEALRRGINEETALKVARTPEQRIAGRSGREVRQSRVIDPASGKLQLVRVVVEIRAGEETIVTVYRSSKIRKYWSEP